MIEELNSFVLSLRKRERADFLWLCCNAQHACLADAVATAEDQWRAAVGSEFGGDDAEPGGATAPRVVDLGLVRKELVSWIEERRPLALRFRATDDFLKMIVDVLLPSYTPRIASLVIFLGDEISSRTQLQQSCLFQQTKLVSRVLSLVESRGSIDILAPAGALTPTVELLALAAASCPELFVEHCGRLGIEELVLLPSRASQSPRVSKEQLVSVVGSVHSLLQALYSSSGILRWCMCVKPLGLLHNASFLDDLDVRLHLVKASVTLMSSSALLSSELLKLSCTSEALRIVSETISEACASSTQRLSDSLLLETVVLLLSIRDDGKGLQEHLAALLCSPHGWEESVWSSCEGDSQVGTFGFHMLVLIAGCDEMFAQASRMLLLVCRRFGHFLIARGMITPATVEILRAALLSVDSIVQGEGLWYLHSILHLFEQITNDDVSFARQKHGSTLLVQCVVDAVCHPVDSVACAAIQILRAQLARAPKLLFCAQCLIDAGALSKLSLQLQMRVTQHRKKISLVLLSDLLQTEVSQISFVDSCSTCILPLLSDKDAALLQLTVETVKLMRVGAFDPSMGIVSLLVRMLGDIKPHDAASVQTCCWVLILLSELARSEPQAKQFIVESARSVVSVCRALSLEAKQRRERDCGIEADPCSNELVPRACHTRAVFGDSPGDGYQILLDALSLTLQLLTSIQESSASSFSDMLMGMISRAVCCGPMLVCSHFTSIVARAFVAMASWSCSSFFGALPRPTANSHPSMVLCDISGGWQPAKLIGDVLFERNTPVLVRRRYLCVLLALMRDASVSVTPNEELLDLASSVINWIVSVFHSDNNVAALATVDFLGMSLDVLLPLSTRDNSILRRASATCVSLVSLFGGMGASASGFLRSFLFCIEENDMHPPRLLNPLTTKRVLDAWGTHLASCLLPSSPRYFTSFGFGCDIAHRSQSSSETQLLHEFGGTTGGLSVLGEFEVFRPHSDLTFCLWFAIDTRMRTTSEKVLLNLSFENFCVHLGLTQHWEFFIRVKVQSHDGVKVQLIRLEGLQQPPPRLWSMLVFTISNTIGRKKKLRTSFSALFSVVLHTLGRRELSSYQQRSEQCQLTIPLSRRDNAEKWVLLSGVNIGACTRPQRADGVNSSEGPTELLFFGSLVAVASRLSLLEQAILFVLGSEGCSGLSFADRSVVVNSVPLLSHVVAHAVHANWAEFSALLSAWCVGAESSQRSQELDSIPTSVVGDALPFSKIGKEKVVLVVCTQMTDLVVYSRVHTGASSSQQTAADAHQQSHNDSLDASFTHFMGAATGLLHQSTMVSEPRSKLMVCFPLQIVTDDSMVDALSLVERPSFYQCTPIFACVQAVGGMQTFLWLSSFLPDSSDAQISAVRCAVLIASLHSPRVLCQRESQQTKEQSTELLRSVLHSRVGICREVAVAVVGACGTRLICRPDLLPLALDFSLWARNPEAMQAVTGYFVDVLTSGSRFVHFNAALLSRFSLLETLLLHLHMHFSGNTSVQWESKLIPSVRTLLIVLLADSGSLSRAVSSAVWLVSDENASATEWAICVLEAALNSLGAQSCTIDIDELDTSYCNNVVLLFRSGSEKIRELSLRLLLRSVPLQEQFCTGVVAEYRARAALFGVDVCIDRTEIRVMFGAVVGGEHFVNDELRLSAEFDEVKHLTPLARPILFTLAALVPSLPDSLQVAVATFLCDVFRRSTGTAQSALSAKIIAPTFEVSLVHTVLFAIAEHFDTKQRANEAATDVVTTALVDLLIDLCCFQVLSAANAPPTKASYAVETIHIVCYSLFSTFVGDEELSSRCLTPLFAAAKQHVQAVCVACLAQFESCFANASHAFLNFFWQFLDILNDITVLLFFSSRPSSGDDITSLLDSSGDRRVYLGCSFIRRNKGVKPLKVRETYRSLYPRTSDSVGLFNDNVELMPIFALQCSAKLAHKIIEGKSSLERQPATKLVSQLQQQQVKLLSYILSLRGSSVLVLQQLALLHLMRVCASTFGGGTKGTSVSHLIRAPGTAAWSVACVQCQSDSLLLAAVAKQREASVIACQFAVHLLVRFQDGSNASQVQNASAALELLRVLLYHDKSAVRQHLSGAVSHLEEIVNTVVEPRTMLDNAETVLLLHSLPERMFSASGVATLQKYTNSQVNHALQRATQNPRVQASVFPQLEIRRCIMSRDRLDSQTQLLQAAVLQKATLYKKSIEDDGNSVIAANAAFRFSLLSWWGELATLYTEQAIDIAQWELDRFMGPEWERVRLRRFIRRPHMMHMSSGPRRKIPAMLSDCVSIVDDVRLLESFTITAIPQTLSSRVLRSDASPFHCKLVLPMDRVPIVLYISSTAISYVAEWYRHNGGVAGAQHGGLSQPTTPLGAGSDVPQMTLEESTDDVMHTPNARFDPHSFASETPLRVATFTPKLSHGKAPSDFRYAHEVPTSRRVISLSSIRAVWPRRNQLRHTAIELLLDAGETLMLAFESEAERKSVNDLVVSLCKPFLDKTLISNDSNRRVWRGWWVEGRISNFKYLLFLNWMAGRSYGDLRQYPVFPHIVADYARDELDLTSENSFRALERPMGAQSKEREEKAKHEYALLEELYDGSHIDHEVQNFDVVPRHYGTHYLPPGAVLHFLVRVQPFTDYFLDMNGKLDDPARVFDSMRNAWAISSTGKDVKEMIPEFFCLPHMYVNQNMIPFGTKQDGSEVWDVALPRWADTPREFTAKMREALESRFVSERLHRWIDLIFGYLQRGRDAVSVSNVFHALTYEGSVDLSSIDDEVLRRGSESQIDNYGQVPMQLFTSRHKPRTKESSATFSSNPCPTLRFHPAVARHSLLLHIDKVVAHSSSSEVEPSTLGCVVFFRSRTQNAAMGVDEGADWALTVATAMSKPPLVLPPSTWTFSAAGVDTPRDLVSLRPSGFVVLDAKDFSKELCSVHLLDAAPTTCATDAPFLYLGTTTGVILVFRVDTQSVQELEIDAPADDAQGLAVCRFIDVAARGKSTTRQALHAQQIDTFFGHTASIVALVCAPEWGILVSLGGDSVVGVWDIHRRVLVRTIAWPETETDSSQQFPPSLLRSFRSDLQPHLVVVNPKGGDIVVAYRGGVGSALALFSINGDVVASAECEQAITALLAVGPFTFAAEGKSVVVFSSLSLSRVMELSHPAVEDAIVSLSINAYGTVLAGADRQGNIFSWKVSS